VFGAVAVVVVIAVVVAIVVAGGGSDGGGSTSTQTFDPAIVYRIRCGGCHGVDGSGGVGPKLADGAIAAKYPNIQDEIDIVTNGRNAMPAFKDRNMSREQIEAVVRYTREKL
jgi:cytochrome c551